MKFKYPGNHLTQEAVAPIYSAARGIYQELCQEPIADDAEALLTRLWDEANPRTRAEFEAFYRRSPIVPQELFQWHEKGGGRRASRAMHAGSIARFLGVRTFCEYGGGVGSDSVALTKHGLKPIWVCDANELNIKIIRRMFEVHGERAPAVFNPLDEDMQGAPKPDLLYSSDVFEHIHDLESFLAPWVKGFKVVIVYAPFGSNSVQHQHTRYPARSFHRFMAAMGYQKIVFNLAIPPFVYLGREFNRADLIRRIRSGA